MVYKKQDLGKNRFFNKKISLINNLNIFKNVLIINLGTFSPTLKY